MSEGGKKLGSRAGLYSSNTARIAIVAVVTIALVLVTAWNLRGKARVKPDPFGTIEQVYAALPEGISWERGDDDGDIVRPISLRRVVTMDLFTGVPDQLDPFIAYLAAREIPADTPESDTFVLVERVDIANGLRAIARAWSQADFSERFDEVLAEALRYAQYPDSLIESQAGLVLLAMEPDLRPGESASDAALVLLSDGGKFCCEFRENWIGVIEHARKVARGEFPDATEMRRLEREGRVNPMTGEVLP